jgi:hypothetical protein
MTCPSIRGTIADMDVEQFMRDGYVVVRGAFSVSVAAACRDVIWDHLASHDVERDDRRTWTKPAIRIDCPNGGPFAEAGSSPALRSAYDLLIGAGRWTPRAGVGGTVPVRFPSEECPGDVGYHIEGSWWNGSSYRANVRSRGRGLLQMFLFSDVGPDDAPTRLLLGSHLFVPPVLAPAGEDGMDGGDVPTLLRPSVLCRQAVSAVGQAGDVYLCHPFAVHTATWPHRGTEPRMMAQPGVEVLDGFAIDGSDESPVAQAIVRSRW